MFGSDNPFNQKPRQNLIRDFDSSAQKNQSHVLLKREIDAFIEEVRQQALNIIYALVETISTDSLADDELPTDCLDALIIEALGGVGDDENIYHQLLTNCVIDAFLSFGVSEDAIHTIFDIDIEAADDAIEAATATIIANMPNDGEPLETFEREFIYGTPSEADEEKGFDAATGKELSNGTLTKKNVGGREIHYKAHFAIRNGAKILVNKRIGNQKIRQSAEQRAATKKAQLKAHSVNASRKRMKSIGKGRKMDLYS
ncbi:hypothetical protein [Acinetobacter modestus]|uniref:Uncharacterized protein n=1 Tax=Acinetobacter modestus TaxID=1776740 RepID=A0ABP2U0E0_9GAMM|nr:hypothetical protein [Acinetobacter modestus]ENU27954.1 hypothetical protein F992_00786 [Acinetobacter modestus]GGA21366.1 hypothetical protein GCM10017554_17990 [Acinetobacter modestus]